MGIGDFIQAGAWRAWLRVGIVRLVVFMVAGLLWFTPLGWSVLLYPEQWLSDLRVAALVSRITGAIWMPTNGSTSIDIGLLFFPLIVADTLVVGYIAWVVSRIVRYRRRSGDT